MGVHERYEFCHIGPHEAVLVRCDAPYRLFRWTKLTEKLRYIRENILDQYLLLRSVLVA
jgi:hypothetical protein